jgi:replicative DNA helicase
MPKSSEPIMPPHDDRAEEAVLGACLLEKEALEKVIRLLDASSFYNERNQIMFQAMLDLQCAHQAVDHLTLMHYLECKQQLDTVGGELSLIDLEAGAITASHAEYYARIVGDCAVRRRLIKAGGQIVRHGYNQKMALSDVLVASKATVNSIRDIDTGAIYSIQEETRGYFKRQIETGGSGGILKTGFEQLDTTVELHLGEMLVIAGTPGDGKSSLALSIMKNLGMNHIGCGIASIEMSTDVVITRLIEQIAELPSSDVKEFFQHMRGERAVIDKTVKDKVNEAMDILGKMPIYINPAGVQNLESIVDFAATAATEHHAKCLIVDHLQIVATKGEDKVQEIARITQGLRSACKDLGMWLILLSQLSRAIQTRDLDKGRRDYRLSDLRGSGTIEQDADVILFLDMPGRRDKEKWKFLQTKQGFTAEQGYFVVAKNRNGPTGEDQALFIPTQAAWRDYAECGLVPTYRL